MADHLFATVRPTFAASAWRRPAGVRVPLYDDPRCGSVARTSATDDFLADETFHPPGSSVPAHSHDRVLIGLVIAGAMRETVAGRDLTLTSGTAFIRPPGTVHAVWFEARTRLFTLELGERWLGRMRALDVARGLECREVMGNAAAAMLRIYSAFLAQLGAPGHGLAVEGQTLTLLAELSREEGGAPRLWLDEARTYLLEHLDRPFRLAEVARLVGVHPVHLSRTFARWFGTSMTAFVRRQRLDLATTLLASTDDAVSAIAERTGFSDQAHLTRIFRRAVGIPPARYRAQVRSRVEDGE